MGEKCGNYTFIVIILELIKCHNCYLLHVSVTENFLLFSALPPFTMFY